jgi:hypothetical protein
LEKCSGLKGLGEYDGINAIIEPWMNITNEDVPGDNEDLILVTNRAAITERDLLKDYLATLPPV